MRTNKVLLVRTNRILWLLAYTQTRGRGKYAVDKIPLRPPRRNGHNDDVIVVGACAATVFGCGKAQLT